MLLTGSTELSRAWGEDGDGKAAIFLVAKMNKSMDQALLDLKLAITNHNYVFIRQQNVDNGLTNAEQENSRIIFVYFCPCRITLIQTQEGVKMIAVDPKLINKHLNDEKLNQICEQLTRDYRQILEEAAL